MADLEKAEIVGTPALEGTYVSEMDMWPLESEEFNRIYPFYDNLRAGKFTTTKCKACGHEVPESAVFDPRFYNCIELEEIYEKFQRIHKDDDGEYCLCKFCGEGFVYGVQYSRDYYRTFYGELYSGKKIGGDGETNQDIRKDEGTSEVLQPGG